MTSGQPVRDIGLTITPTSTAFGSRNPNSRERGQPLTPELAVDGQSRPKKVWISIHAGNSGVNGDPHPFCVQRGAWLTNSAVRSAPQQTGDAPARWNSFLTSWSRFRPSEGIPDELEQLPDKLKWLQAVGRDT
ncbi:hypothetical protein PSTG_03721 [Puccinia striiformis f. sp. tritici PST-78]|uniref:Uncharacterized protein n=1 Tax=Puccinia striiformis f. sp. tritici PST-78 TaxID=1165861 RepID=A0A0L0VV46_9BASI|nr:hypothetical protein PSTG_03721 [Puccinia striiformis f. sp. tritici PST-78]